MRIWWETGGRGGVGAWVNACGVYRGCRGREEEVRAAWVERAERRAKTMGEGGIEMDGTTQDIVVRT